ALAESLRCDVLLMDEQTGRAVALSRNLPVSGTLGVLERLDKLGLLNDFPCVLHDLRRSGLSVSDSLKQLLLDRHQKRSGKCLSISPRGSFAREADCDPVYFARTIQVFNCCPFFYRL